MKYDARIEIVYLPASEPFPDNARRVLMTAARAEFEANNADLAVLEFIISAEPSGVLILRATLQGKSPNILTSPLEAITRLDTSLDRALLRTGMFEEFDVARKTLHVSPFNISK